MIEIEYKLTEDETKMVKRWAPILEKCGNLATPKEKLYLANTLDAFRQSYNAANLKDRILEDGGTIYISNPTGTKRLAISYDDKGDFSITSQHKDWVNN